MGAQLGVGNQLEHGVAKFDVITRCNQLLFDNAIKRRTDVGLAHIVT